MAKLLKNSTVGGKVIAVIEDLTPIITSLNIHKSDEVGHITTAERTAWNAKSGGVHTHAIGEITGLQVAIDGKAPISHTHTIANVTGLQAALDLKETIVGAQTKATKALTDSNVYTDAKIAALVGSAPGTLDALDELARALGNDPNFATTIATQIGSKVDTTTFNTHVNDAVKHISVAERTAWNAKANGTHSHSIGEVTGLQVALDAKETPAGAQAKATLAETNAKNASLSLVSGGKVLGDTTIETSTATPLKVSRTNASNNVNMAFQHTGATAYIGIDTTGAFRIGSVSDLNASGNLIETATGSQTKATQALNDSKTYTNTEVAKRALTTHNHTTAQVTGLDAKFTAIDSSFTGVTALINGKADVVHLHTISNVTGLQAEIDKQVLKTGDTMTGELKMENKITFKSKFSIEYNTTDDSLDFVYN